MALPRPDLWGLASVESRTLRGAALGSGALWPQRPMTKRWGHAETRGGSRPILQRSARAVGRALPKPSSAGTDCRLIPLLTPR